ncbi:MAG: hypothetical protein M1839_004050 [Geoglossum umbratile]|nr:MAG: hypothetical protein M1839_004050 [Geoglossum umbratile]
MLLVRLPALAVALVGLGMSVSASCLRGTEFERRHYTYKRAEGKTVEVSKFGYTGLQGPLNWAGLSADNSDCREGNNQSPINLNSKIGRIAPGTMKLSIPNGAAELENLGSTVEVVMEGLNGTLTLENKTFDLQQFHFHTPSEHRIDEEHFPLEMHMVHQTADGSDTAVVAVLFQLSEGRKSTPLVKSALAKVHDVATPGSVTETCELDFSKFVKALSKQEMFRYTGSLTTPPCKEGLTFLINTEPLKLDIKTYNNVKKVIKFNSRYTQNDLGQENLLKVGCAK